MLNTALNLNQGIFSSNPTKDSTRNGFGNGLLEIGEKYPQMLVLSADLSESVRVHRFAKKYPKRYIECGIAEQNMVSIAAGLALSGKIPLVTSHAIFSPSTNWAQIRLSVCITNANVKIVGTHQGFSNGPDGGVAEPFEDVALMRVLPNMLVINPIDAIQTVSAVENAVRHKGPVYLRLNKANVTTITTKNTPFKIGGGLVLIEGNDATIATTGPITAEVLAAARELKSNRNIDVEVVALPTIKPLDETTLLKSVKKTGKIIVVEEHQINGGLAGAIAEVLSENLPTPMLRIGMEDSFGESGQYHQLLEKYKMDALSIIDKVTKFV